MAAKKIASAETTTINLPRLNIAHMGVTIIGDSPLIVHAWAEKAKKEMLDKQVGRAKGPRDKKDPVADYEATMYRFEDGGHGFPSVAFKAAAVTAGTSISGLTKIQARQAFHIVGEDMDIAGSWDGAKSRTNLIRILGCEPQMREDMVRVGMGTADIRYRAEYVNWHAVLNIRYNVNVLTEEQILNLINTAGFAVGVGEWRPEKDGSYGMFHVATAGEVDLLEP